MKRRDFINILGGAIAMTVIAPNVVLANNNQYEFTPEALALFNAMIGEPDMEWKIAVDIRIRELKKSGVWDKLDMLYLFADTCISLTDEHNYQNTLINWINPGTNDLKYNQNIIFEKNEGIIDPKTGMLFKSISIGEGRIDIESLPELEPIKLNILNINASLKAT